MYRSWIVTVFGTLAAASLACGCSKNKDAAKSGDTPPAEARAAGKAKAEAKKVTREAPRARAEEEDGPRLVQLWSTGGLEVPESVLHDGARKVFYVSCISGKPTQKNGKGFISKLSLDGKIETLRWAEGMNAPKGMGIKGDTLYVTDIDRLHAIDLKTGKITRTVKEPKAKFLNDIAIGPKGRVFVSDMTTGLVHVLKGKKLEQFSDLSALKGANGMLLHKGRLLAGTATGIAQIDLKTGKSSLFVQVKDFGMIDGLQAYGEDAWIVSNWKGRTQIVRKDGAVTVLKDTTAEKIQSADLEYVADARTLLIPTFFHNHVTAYRIEP